MLKSKNPKVLVAAPIFDKMKYCSKEFINSIKAIDYNNYNFLLVDNSKTNEFFNELKKEKGIILLKDNIEETNLKKVVSSRNKILQYALDNFYDYVLMMDSDVIPPKNIIPELLNCKKDIVSGIYFNYFNSGGKMKFLPVAWRSISPKEFEEIKAKVNLGPLVKSNLDIRRHLTSEEAESNELIKVLIPSPGCMLIKKSVFEKVKYGLVEVPNNIYTSDDIYFMQKARELGFESYCHTKIKCKHLLEGKYEKDSEGNLQHPLFK